MEAVNGESVVESEEVKKEPSKEEDNMEVPADDPLSEDQWLYGDDEGQGGGEGVPPAPEEKEKAEEPPKPQEEPPPPETQENPPEQEEELSREPGEVADNEGEEGEEPGEITKDQEEDAIHPPGEEDTSKTQPAEGGEGEDEEEDDEESDDDVRVTIGDIKTTPQYGSLNIKRGPTLLSGMDKLNKQQGKFSIEEFESIGTINGVPAHEFSIDALEEKPWRKPGADITDYFNYGFNEDTWRSYCERQKQLRVHESGVGLLGIGVASSRMNSAVTIVNDNSKYSSMNSTVVVGPAATARKAGPPPGPRRGSGIIDVIGSSGVASRRTTDSPPQENVIQVMTADRRDYGRKGFDVTVPPPGFETGQPPLGPVISNYPPHPSYGPDFYNSEVDPYYAPPYEPPPDMWGSQSNSLSKEPDLPSGGSIKQEPSEKSSKERDRERDRHKDRHRHRSRSRSGDRSERRSRKHKSRSRSPGHRSHKKKKSKKSERSKEGSD